MADKISFDPDTNEGEIPEYAKEATQKKILAALAKQFKLDTKSLDSAQKALDEMRELNDNTEELTDAQRDLADNLHRNLRGGGTMGTLFGAAGQLTSGMLSAVGAVAGFSTALVAGAAAIGMGVANFATGLGEELNSLNQYGIGFQGGLIDATANLNSLGLKTSEAVDLILKSSTA